MGKAMMVSVNSAVTDTLTLYDSGDECTDITGGWGNYWQDIPNGTWWRPNCYIGTKNADHVYLYSKGSPRRTESIATTNKISTVGFTTLCAEIEVESIYSNADVYVGFATSMTCSDTDISYAAYKSKYGAVSGRCVLRKEGIPQGEYYIMVRGYANDSSSYCVAKVHKVWLEKDTTHMADVAREVEQIYTEADLVAREVTEGWVEVDLVARKFFGNGYYLSHVLETSSYVTTEAYINSSGSYYGKVHTTYVPSNQFGKSMIKIFDNKTGEIAVLPKGTVITFTARYKTTNTQSPFIIGYRTVSADKWVDYVMTTDSSGTITKTFTATEDIFGFSFNAQTGWGVVATVEVWIDSLEINGEQVFPY